MSQTIQTPRNLAPPSFLKQMREFALPVDLLKYSLHYPRLITAPRGDGRSVFLLPGYGAGEMSMLPLSAFLGTLGYDVHPWGLGRNRGGVERMVARFARNIEDHIHRHQNGPVTLIGWSLGGVVAREVAREYPDTVREVITMGTPIIGGPKYTAVGARYARNDRIDLDAIEAEAHRRNLRGLLQPLTVIYSRDLDWAEQLGRLPEDIDRAKADAIRDWDRGLLWSTIGHGEQRPPPDQPGRVVEAALDHIARSPAYLASAPLEDLLGDIEQPNLPGTTSEHPNWRRRFPAPIGTLLSEQPVQRRVNAFARR